jgi:PAS domain S-box-containing protein
MHKPGAIDDGPTPPRTATGVSPRRMTALEESLRDLLDLPVDFGPPAPARGGMALQDEDASPLFATIVEEAFSEIIVFDALTLKPLLVNARARRNLGYPVAELSVLTIDRIKLGQNLGDVVKTLLSGEKSRCVSQGQHRRKDGSTYPVEEYSQISSLAGRRVVFQTVVDQTDIVRLDSQAELLSYIELDASGTQSSDEFMRSVLRRVTRYLDCSAGHAFYWDSHLKALRSSGLWHFGPAEPWHMRVREAAETAMFDSGCGIVGRVHAEKSAVLGRTPDDDEKVFGPRLAIDGPVGPALAIPIFANNDVSAVIEFYSTGRIDHERLLYGLSEKIGMQVSRLFERKRVDEDLAEARDRFSAAVRSANVGVWDYNHRTGKSYLSDHAREILGFNEASPPTDWKGYLDRIHPDDIERKLAAMTAHTVQRLPYDVEYRLRRPSGDYVWIRARAQGAWDDQGSIIRSVGTVDDISASKEAELLRHEIMTLLAGNMNMASKITATLDLACRYLKLPAGVVSHVTDDRYEVLYASSEASEALRGTTYSLSQTICSDVLFSDDVRGIPDLDRSPLNTHPGRELLSTAAYLGAPYFVNGIRFGTICFFSSTGRQTPFLEAEIAIIRLLALWIGDQIGRNSYIANLVENDLRKTANLASVGDAVLTLNDVGIVEDANPAAAVLFGILETDLCGKHISELLPSALSLSHPDGRLAPVSARHDIAVHSDGRRIAVVLHVSEVRLADRTVYAVALTDWTAVKQAETAKREFVSVVSHELRTPLTSIRGALGLIAAQKTGPLTPATANLVQIAQKNSERLVKLVNDILDMEKLESGRFELDLQRFDLEPVLADTINANTAYAARFGVSFTLTVDSRLRPVLADPDRFLQIMANLLSNAAKFTRPDTAVHIHAAANGNFARVQVRDHGTGIPASLRSSLFEKFAQGNNSNTREREGSGLGLSISRQLARRMNGEVGVLASTPDGSTFFVDLPFAEPAHGALDQQLSDNRGPTDRRGE